MLPQADTADAETIGAVNDHFSGVGFGEVDGGGAEGLSQLEPIGLLVDDEDLRGAAQGRAVRGHEPDRASAKDRHCVPGAHLGQLGTVIPGGEDVREQREVQSRARCSPLLLLSFRVMPLGYPLQTGACVAWSGAHGRTGGLGAWAGAWWSCVLGLPGSGGVSGAGAGVPGGRDRSRPVG